MTRQSFLARLGPDAVGKLRALGSRRRFPAGATIFVEGDEAFEALVLLSGTVKVTVTAAGGREVILDVLGEGEIVGELAVVDGEARSATAKALDQVEVLAIARLAFVEFLHAQPAVMFDLLVSVMGRLRNSDQRQLEFGTGDALGRVCGRLGELADRYGAPAAGGAVQFESPVSQGDLAAWTGISREALVKSLRTLRDLGWIENQGRRFTILQPHAVHGRATG